MVALAGLVGRTDVDFSKWWVLFVDERNVPLASDDSNYKAAHQELLRKVKAAQYVASHPGEVCPAKWQEGAATLKPSLDLVGKI